MRSINFRRRKMTLGRSVAAATFLILLASVAPAAADKVTGLAEKLSSLRGEVEQLSADLARKDTEIRDQLKALSRQKTELELELKREQTRIQKVQLSINDRKKRIADEQGQDEQLEPLFTESLKDVRQYVKGTLPFRTSERLAELDKLEDQHKQGLLSASKATSRLWTFVEDEFRLTRESGLYKQAVSVDGKEHLAEVVRLGMVLLYFRVDDQFVGQAKRDGDAWKFERIDDADDKKLVLELFESFKKQIRVGLFKVPAALPAPVESTIPSEPRQERSKATPPEKPEKEEGKEAEEAGKQPAAASPTPDSAPAEPQKAEGAAQ